MNRNTENSNVIFTWKSLKKSQRISLLEEYELSIGDFETYTRKQKDRFKELALKNYLFRDKADWSIICDLKRIEEENKIDLIMASCR